MTEDTQGKLANFDLHATVITDTIAQLREKFTDGLITTKKDLETFKGPLQTEISTHSGKTSTYYCYKVALLTMCCSTRAQAYLAQPRDKPQRQASGSNIQPEKPDITWALANTALALIMAMRKGELTYEATDCLRLLATLEPSTEKTMGNWCTPNPDLQKIWANFNGLLNGTNKLSTYILITKIV